MGAFSDYEKNRLLDASTNRAAASATPFWVQLHTGSPGAAGTSNVSTHTTRIQATFGTAPSAGSIANTAVVTWTGLAITPATETVTHVSFWDAATSGNFKGADDLPANKIVQDDDAVAIPIGALTLQITGTLP